MNQPNLFTPQPRPAADPPRSSPAAASELPRDVQLATDRLWTAWCLASETEREALLERIRAAFL